MADRPLRPATDHRLGRPLPHQLANRPQAPPGAPEPLPGTLQQRQNHGVLAAVSSGYPPLRGRSPTCYSPVRHFPPAASSEESTAGFSFDLHVLGTPPAFILSQDQTLRKSPNLTRTPVWPGHLRLSRPTSGYKPNARRAFLFAWPAYLTTLQLLMCLSSRPSHPSLQPQGASPYSSTIPPRRQIRPPPWVQL